MTAELKTAVANATTLNTRVCFRTEETKVTDESVPRQDAIKNGVRKIILGALEFPLLFIEVHQSEVPWLKLFVRRNVREFSECTPEEKAAVWQALDVIEKAMLDYYRPEKINIASFGNMLPQVHWHIMARFREDSYFPEPMWGPRQREGVLQLPPVEPLLTQIFRNLTDTFHNNEPLLP
jgi:diadenosine tetraphosphate (Ap4A) HIT family hydrolase